MFDKMLNVIKNKDITIPKLLLYNYKDMNIDNEELIVLIYLLNLDNDIYNPNDISNDLKLELIQVLTIVGNLTEKGIIKIDMVKRNNMKVEIINLEPLYEKLTFLIVNENEKTDNSIYTMFESEFARSLSPVEYDLINEWKKDGFTDEIISLALKEAIYNGVTSLKYIDRILDEWRKKGITNKEQLDKSKKVFRQKKDKSTKKELFSYDWLNDEE